MGPSAYSMSDPPDIQQGYMHKLRCGLFTTWFILNNIYCIPTYLVWMFILLPVRFIRSKLYWNIESVLFKWLLALVAGWIYSAGYKIYELGHNLIQCQDDESLLLINHQSAADVPLLMYGLQNKKQLDRTLWIMWHILKYFNFGWVSQVHGDFFIKEGKDKRESQLNLLRTHLIENFYSRERKWIILFPEGGFLCNRKESSQRYAQKNNLPVLEHVTLPRVGAVHTIIETLTSKNHVKDDHKDLGFKDLKWIIDITVAYPNGKPITMLNLMSGNRSPCDIYMHYRLYPISSVPLDVEPMTMWLYDRYVEKEELLNTYYKMGSFPNPEGHQKLVTLNHWLLFRLHIFFILSSAFHIFLFKMILLG